MTFIIWVKAMIVITGFAGIFIAAIGVYFIGFEFIQWSIGATDMAELIKGVVRVGAASGMGAFTYYLFVEIMKQFP